MEGFRRRVRIMAGNIQQLREIGSLLYATSSTALVLFRVPQRAAIDCSIRNDRFLVANIFLLNKPIYRLLLSGTDRFLCSGDLRSDDSITP